MEKSSTIKTEALLPAPEYFVEVCVTARRSAPPVPGGEALLRNLDITDAVRGAGCLSATPSPFPTADAPRDVGGPDDGDGGRCWCAGCFVRENVDLVDFGVVISAGSFPRPSSVPRGQGDPRPVGK